MGRNPLAVEHRGAGHPDETRGLDRLGYPQDRQERLHLGGKGLADPKPGPGGPIQDEDPVPGPRQDDRRCHARRAAAHHQDVHVVETPGHGFS